jgi:hypothetical protein
MEQHSDVMYNKIGSLIRDNIPQIQSAFLRFTDPATEEFFVSLREGCLVRQSLRCSVSSSLKLSIARRIRSLLLTE